MPKQKIDVLFCSVDILVKALHWLAKRLSCNIHLVFRCIIVFMLSKGHELSPSNYFLPIMVAYPGHILESTKGIEIKLGTYIDVNEREYRRQEP